MAKASLAFEGVTKRFGDFTAVSDLSFSVAEGGVFGFLGGNGAGKTTSLRMALDILRRALAGSKFSALRRAGNMPGTLASCRRNAVSTGR
jgi:ABC-type uncharacterized transport system ATPase subunit